MKSWNLFFRRTHLYLGMALLPWMIVYALSTVVFNHPDWFRAETPTAQLWLPLWEKDLTIDLPPTGGDALRETARRILADHGFVGPFGAQRQGQRLVINFQNFQEPVRLTYDAASKKLRAEKRRFAWSEVLKRLHERTGYGQPGILPTVWAVIVDLFCISTLVWIATGLYLWWKLPVVRTWGFATLAAGLATILILLGTL